jgi:hypothetical protein
MQASRRGAGVFADEMATVGRYVGATNGRIE